MSGENRTAIIAKLVKVAKKHYPVVSPPASRSVLENLLYACLLENSSFAAADEAFARLEQYADWNEVRVTTAQELCEMSAGLTDPQVAIERLKLALHSIFESHYSFELDFLIKENQGKVVAQLEKYKGVTPFVVSYLVQNSFGGHKIPTCDASLHFAEMLGLVTPKEKESGTIPGFERAVPKTKGPEFFSTMHQFAVDYFQSPSDKQILARVKEVSPDAVKRLDANSQVAKAAGAKAAAPKTDSGKASGGKPDGGKADSGQASGGKAVAGKSPAGSAVEATAVRDANKKTPAGKSGAAATAAENSAGLVADRKGSGKAGGGTASDGKSSSGAKGKSEVTSKAPVDAKAGAAKAAGKSTATTPPTSAAKPTASKPAAKSPPAKPAAKSSPAPPAGKKPSGVKSAVPSEKPAAKVVPGKKKPR